MQREVLAMNQRLLGTNSLPVAKSLHDLAMLMLTARKLNQAEDLARQCLTIVKKLLGEEHPHTADAVSALVAILQAAGKLEEAETLCQQHLAQLRREPSDDSTL